MTALQFNSDPKKSQQTAREELAAALTAFIDERMQRFWTMPLDPKTCLPENWTAATGAKVVTAATPQP